MRIGFFSQGQEHTENAKYLIATAKHYMPDVPLYHLTDGQSQSPDGALTLRISEPMPMGVRRITHYSRLNGNWLFLDTDVIFQQDVRDVFERPFDVALVSRKGTAWANSEYAKQYPFNFGVVFSKNPKYWEFTLAHLKTLSPELQEWGGEQQATCDLAMQAMSCFSVEVLPSSYNFTPFTRDEDVSDKAILHYKGPRKVWLPEATERSLNARLSV